MTDTTITEPWPVPAGSLAPRDLPEILESMSFLVASLEPSALELLDKRPAKDDACHEVWMHDLAVLVDVLETVVDKAKEVQAAAAAAFCRDLPFPAPGNVSYADTRPMVPRFPANRTAWHNDDLARDIRATVLANVDKTKTDFREGAEFGVTAIEKVVTLSGGNAKTTGIRALGLDPDDYCHSEKKDPTLQVVK